jgi:hypothetical protein
MTRYTHIRIENGVVSVSITEEGLPNNEVQEIVEQIDARTARVRAMSQKLEPPPTQE